MGVLLNDFVYLSIDLTQNNIQTSNDRHHVRDHLALAHDRQRRQVHETRPAEVYAIGAKDRYSGYELMGVMILEPQADRLHIDSFLLSCRILGRTLETAALGFACQLAQQLGASTLSAEIIETERNTPVRDVYARHGFTALGDGRFELPLSTPVAVPAYFTVDA